MPEQLSEPPPPPPPPPPSPPPPSQDERRLVRDPDDQVIAGVCAAFGRYTDTDPVLWRVTLAVLALFGGAGLVLYALGWVLVPRRGEQESAVERTLRGREGGLSPAGVVLLVIGAIVLLAVIDDGPGVAVLLVVGGLAWLVARERRRSPAGEVATRPAPYAPTSYAPTDCSPAPFDEAPAYGTPSPWSVPPPTPRRRSPLGGLTLSAAALLAGLLLALDVLGVGGITPPRVVAAVLLVVGAGLLVGAWFGRARWLLPVGLLLALVLAGTAAADEAGLPNGVGERTWVVSGSSSYRLGAGEAVLDLTRLEPGARATVDARVGFGELTVLVPEDVVARVTSDVGLGTIWQSGLDGQRRQVTAPPGDGEASSTYRDEQIVLGGSSEDVTVDVDLEVGLGEIEVRRVAS